MEPKDQIKNRIDVAELIGEYLQLKPAGSGSFKTTCPFHSEKTPSFYISVPKQIWHCFGCDKGGDIFSFVMEMDGMTFPEALQYLGKKAGVEVEFKRQNKQVSDAKQFMLDLHQIAEKFYQTILWEHKAGKVARDYLQERGISEELAKKFGFGYAPEKWTVLVDFFKRKGFGEERLIAAGLAKKRQKGSGAIDKFRGRLMIPLRNSSSQTVGFTGRILEKEAKGPKYMNSPETLIYKKSDLLFGLDLARTSIRKNDAAIIVEGNLDVVASHKGGVENIVASSGTALTESQLNILKRLSPRLVFCFDGDSAGEKAARRGIQLAQSMDFSIKVIDIPEELGKDPDDVVQKNPEAWKDLVENAIELMEYYFRKGLKKYDLQSAEEKSIFARELLDEMQNIKDPLQREHWLLKLSDLTHISIDLLRRQIGSKKTVSRSSRGITLPTKLPIKAKKRMNRDERASFIIIGAIFGGEKEILEMVFQHDLTVYLTNKEVREIYKSAQMLYNQNEIIDSTQKQILLVLEEEFSSNANIIHLIKKIAIFSEREFADLSPNQVREELNQQIAFLKSFKIEQRKKELETQIRQAEQSNNREHLDELLNEYKSIL